MVPAQDRPLQECQRAELPLELARRAGLLRPHPQAQAGPPRLLQAVQGQPPGQPQPRIRHRREVPRHPPYARRRR